MTGSNASYQQLGLGVDAMMSSSCFVSGDGSSVISTDTAPFFQFHHHVPEYTPHGGGSFGFGFGEPSATSFSAADGSVLLAGQLLRATALQSVSVSPEGETHGDVTVAHAPRMMPKAKQQLLAGEPHGHGGGWIHEEPAYYYCPTTTWFTAGDPFAGPAAAAPASELSLRLRAAGSSPKAAGAVSVSLPDQSSEVSCSGPGGLLQQPAPCGGAAGAGQVVARPAGPVHFSQVLSRWSGYAEITQQALDEFVSCLLQDVPGFAEPSCRLPSPSCCSSKTTTTPSVFAVGSESSEEHNSHNKLLKNHLQKLLQLMDQRCKECMDEIESAASKYGSLVRPAGGGGRSLSAAPFAHRAVSAMHRRLRARITGEIAAAATRRRGDHVHEQQPSSSSLSLADRERSWESAFIQKHWALRQLRRGDQQQSWRPQRGLPEKSVAVLKAWMFENFLRPYPKDNEKEMLAARSGLSRSQVSNWFINARVRLWKPMIEEMYEDLKKASGGMENK